MQKLLPGSSLCLPIVVIPHTSKQYHALQRLDHRQRLLMTSQTVLDS
jgi:hypothetical protein